MAANELFTFFADVKQRLGVASAVITVPKDVTCTHFSVFVKEDEIEVKSSAKSDSELLYRFKIAGISMQPTVVHQVERDSYHCLELRLQLHRHYTAVLSNASCPKPRVHSSNVIKWTGRADAVMKILRGKSYAIRCRMCALIILQNKTGRLTQRGDASIEFSMRSRVSHLFRRVQPLSCDLSEISETWWCHQHDHHSDHDHNLDPTDLQDTSSCAIDKSGQFKDLSDVGEPISNGNFNPLHNDRLSHSDSCDQKSCLNKQNKDELYGNQIKCDQSMVEVSQSGSNGDKCFVNDTFLVTNEGCLQSKSIMKTDKRWIQCSRCRCIIGHTLEETDVAHRRFQCLAGNEKYVQLMMHMLAISSDVMNVMPLYRVLPEPSEKFSFALEAVLKLLELELASCLFEEHQTNNYFRFVIEMRNGENKLVPVVLLSVLDANALMYNTSVAVEKNVAYPLHVIKLLYKDCLREQNRSTGFGWRHDFTVHSIELPETMCLSILRILVDSTKHLSQSLRSVNNFYVGYLLQTH